MYVLLAHSVLKISCITDNIIEKNACRLFVFLLFWVAQNYKKTL
jgi:hypothetical protein